MQDWENISSNMTLMTSFAYFNVFFVSHYDWLTVPPHSRQNNIIIQWNRTTTQHILDSLCKVNLFLINISLPCLLMRPRAASVPPLPPPSTPLLLQKVLIEAMLLHRSSTHRLQHKHTQQRLSITTVSAESRLHLHHHNNPRWPQLRALWGFMSLFFSFHLWSTINQKIYLIYPCNSKMFQIRDSFLQVCVGHVQPDLDLYIYISI